MPTQDSDLTYPVSTAWWCMCVRVCAEVCAKVCVCVHGDWGQPLPKLLICYLPCPLRQSLQRPRTHEVSLAGWPASPGNAPFFAAQY